MLKTLLTSFFLVTAAPLLQAHCQLPCGIYHDDLEFALISESIETINKALKELEGHDSQTPEDRNQTVRWVLEKEKQADFIANRMSYYFLQQRIKAESKGYESLLKSAHQVLVFSMKVKQTVDQDVVDSLEKEVDVFKRLYSKK